MGYHIPIRRVVLTVVLSWQSKQPIRGKENHDNGFKDRLGSMTVLGVDDGGSDKRYLVKRHYSKDDLEMALGKPSDKFIIDDSGKVLATWPQCRSFWEWSNL